MGFLWFGATWDMDIVIDNARQGKTESVNEALNDMNAKVDVCAVHSERGTTALMEAARGGYHRMAASLIKKARGEDRAVYMINMRDPSGNTALNKAAYHTGSSDIVQLLIVNGADVNLADNNGNTPLINAASSYNPNSSLIVNQLIAARASIEATNNDGDTALMRAVFNGNKLDARALLHAGANPVVQNKNGETPLMLAVERDNLEMVKDIINAIKSGDRDVVSAVNVSNTTNGETALSLAVRNWMNNETSSRDIVELLLQNGADPNVRYGTKNESSLVFAMRNWRCDIMEMLLKHKANPNETFRRGSNDFEETVLTYVAKSGRIDMVQALLDAGADVNATDRHGNTPLIKAAFWNHPEVVMALLTHPNSQDKIKLDAKATGGLNAYNATLSKDPRRPRGGYAQFILMNPSTALLRAAERGGCSDADERAQSFPLASFILNNTISEESKKKFLSATDENGQNALMVAIRNNNDPRLINALISASNGVKLDENNKLIDMQDNEGYTALMRATQNGDFETVKKIIAAGADLNIQNNRGQTVMDIVGSMTPVSGRTVGDLGRDPKSATYLNIYNFIREQGGRHGTPNAVSSLQRSATSLGDDLPIPKMGNRNDYTA